MRDRVCQLLPGKRIYLLDVIKDERGVSRALAAVDSEDVDEELKLAEQTWRKTYGARPAWIDAMF